MKAKLRTGTVKKPQLLKDVQAPLQKLCKNSQWFDNVTEAGRALVKPDRFVLNKQFKKQTDKIWQVSYLMHYLGNGESGIIFAAVFS